MPAPAPEPRALGLALELLGLCGELQSLGFAVAAVCVEAGCLGNACLGKREASIRRQTNLYEIGGKRQKDVVSTLRRSDHQPLV